VAGEAHQLGFSHLPAELAGRRLQDPVGRFGGDGELGRARSAEADAAFLALAAVEAGEGARDPGRQGLGQTHQFVVVTAGDGAALAVEQTQAFRVLHG